MNTGSFATGGQTGPRIIGLSSGNLLVAWEVDASGTEGATGIDIMAKIHDAGGNIVSDSFRLNRNFSVDDERDFDIAATHDGGLAVAYVDDDIGTDSSDIIVERFTEGGLPLFQVTIDQESESPTTVSSRASPWTRPPTTLSSPSANPSTRTVPIWTCSTGRSVTPAR